jgi:hypothetical protein
MTNNTGWIGGRGVGNTWTAMFASGDLTSCPASDSIMSSNIIDNTSANDDFCFVSVEITVGSITPANGSFIGIWAGILQNDGTTYGDGVLTAGTQKAYLPVFAPMCFLPVESSVAATVFVANSPPLLMPPTKFRFILYNGTNFTFSATAGNNTAKYVTFNQSLNS